MDRLAELAEQMYDEALRRVEATVGEGAVSFKTRLTSLRAALSLCTTALEGARSRRAEAAKVEALRPEQPVGRRWRVRVWSTREGNPVEWLSVWSDDGWTTSGNPVEAYIFDNQPVLRTAVKAWVSSPVAVEEWQPESSAWVDVVPAG